MKDGCGTYCVLRTYNFSGVCLFCTIFSYIDTSEVERQSTRESGLIFFTCSGPCRCQTITCLSSAGVSVAEVWCTEVWCT